MKPRPWDKTHPKNFFRKVDVVELEERVSKIEAFLQQCFVMEFGEFAERLQRIPTKTKRGPKSRVPLTQLLISRDVLVRYLETYWPELQPLFKRPKQTTAIRKALATLSDPQNGPTAPVMRTLLRNFEALISFLSSEEYNGDPRQVANAMAGVPDISWATSLKRCRAHPSDEAIHERALRDYLQRRHHDIYVRLINAKHVDTVRCIMESKRTNDREFNWLCAHPEDVLQVMDMGLPKEIWGDAQSGEESIAEEDRIRALPPPPTL